MKMTFLSALAVAATASVATAEDVDAFSNAQLAEVRSVYFNATPAIEADTDRLTIERVAAIQDAFDVYLIYTPDVDALAQDDIQRIKRQFDKVLSTEENLVTLDGAPIFIASN